MIGLNQDGRDWRIVQDHGMNQDGMDGRMDQDYDQMSLERPPYCRGVLHTPAAYFELIIGLQRRTVPLSSIMDDMY